MPPRPVLLGLLTLAVAPPFLALLSGSSVGAFGMFARLERHHLEIDVVLPSGSRRFALRRLAPHLSRDARRIVLPADGYPLGADQVELLAGGLHDLGRLTCELETAATLARVRFYRGRPGGHHPLAEHRVDVPCARN
jgi:hypothetical protein